MELGGNIFLEGFESQDFTELIVVKKLVGQYARRLADAGGGAEKIHVTLSESGKTSTVSVEIQRDGTFTSSVTMENLYMALDQALREAVAKAEN